MTFEERRRAICELGFTERQAGFLVTVMLHAGVCFGRHYCSFARIRHGKAVTDFYKSLVDREYATVRGCKHPTARLYHIQHKALYRAIGEPDNKNRRPTVLARAIERVMLLDAILADRAGTWLATETEKVAYFTVRHGIRHGDLPARTYEGGESETVRYFPDKLPISFDADGRTHLFLFLITEPRPVGFRAFLERHAELLRSLPAWTIRLLVPWFRRESVALYEEAFDEQLGSPLSPAVLEDLRWYFRARSTHGGGADERLDEAAYAFGAPKFRALYRAFLERGEPALDATLSPTLADAIARGTGQLENHVLPHQYAYLSSLVGTA
jgi:hypothetical protein